MFFEYEGAPYHVLDVEVSRPTARGGQTLVRIKMRNLVTRAVFDKTFKAGEKFGEPDLVMVDAAYLYADSGGLNFMDQETFETLTLRPELLGDDRLLLVDNLIVQVQKFNGNPDRRAVSAARRDGGQRHRRRRARQHGQRQRDQGRPPRIGPRDSGTALHQAVGEKVRVHTETQGVCRTGVTIDNWQISSIGKCIASNLIVQS